MYESPHAGYLPSAGPLDWSIALLRWGGFWSAVCLPFVHLPLLALSGLTATTTPLLVALWVANAVALVLGRQHSPHGRARPSEEVGR